MSTYVVGDIQGCYDELREMLDLVRFEPSADRLWLVGDLVNRGPLSLATLRFVRSLGPAARVVLGNHDFHLLAVAEGFARMHRSDTLSPILACADRDELLAWVRSWPLAHSEAGVLMVHAGVLPSWTVSSTIAFSDEVSAVLTGPDYREFLRTLYGDQPAQWSTALTGQDRWRAIVNACTRLRFCTTDDRMEFGEKRGPGHAPPGYLPWFEHAHRGTRDTPIVFGHWSTLDLILTESVVMLDTGCVWGRSLTAMRLGDRRLFEVRSHQPHLPKPS